jgi:hypothetical protein
MKTYTRDQLIAAQSIYNKLAITEPGKFVPISDTNNTAIGQIDYLISIVEGTCPDLQPKK